MSYLDDVLGISGNPTSNPNSASQTNPGNAGGAGWYGVGGGWMPLTPDDDELDKDKNGGDFSTPRPLQIGDNVSTQGGSDGFSLNKNANWPTLAPVTKESSSTLPDWTFDLNDAGQPRLGADSQAGDVNPDDYTKAILGSQPETVLHGGASNNSLLPQDGSNGAISTSNEFNAPVAFTIAGAGSNGGYPNDQGPDFMKPLGLNTGTKAEGLTPTGFDGYVSNQPSGATQPGTNDLGQSPSKSKLNVPNEFDGPADFNVSNGRDLRQNWNRNIVGTVFTGPGDQNKSKYTGKVIDPDKPGASLPYVFPYQPGQLPGVYIEITSRRTGKSIVVPIVDAGPHYSRKDYDPYWMTGTLPKAQMKETGNHSGIDMTPYTARALGLPVSQGKEGRAAAIKTIHDEEFHFRFVPPPAH